MHELQQAIIGNLSAQLNPSLSGADFGDVAEPGPFPVDALNPVMRNIGSSAAEVHQIDPALPAMATIATLSGAMGRYWKSKVVGGKETHSNLFVLVGAPKSYGKSSTTDMVRPILDENERRHDQYADKEWPMYKARLHELEIQIKELSKSLAKPAKSGTSASDSKAGYLRQQLADAYSESRDLDKLMRLPPNLWIGNATSAALVAHLRRNDGTLFSFSPEAGDLVRIALGKFSGNEKADIDILLSGYSVEPVAETRISRGDVRLRPCLSLLWMCQPFIIRELLGNEEALERGLTARMLICCVAHNRIPEDDGQDHEIPDEHREDWETLINKILKHRQSEKPEQIIEWSAGAKEAFRSFHNEIVGLRNGPLRDSEGEFGRLRENAIRLAIGQHAADSFSELTELGIGTEKQAERGIQIARWCFSSAVTIFSEGRERRLKDRLARLLEILLNNGNSSISLRDLNRRHGFRKWETRHLAERYAEQIRVEKTKAGSAGGRPSEILVLL